MKKLLLVVALVAGVLVVKAQDTQEQDVAKNSQNERNDASSKDDDSRTNEDADDSQGSEQDNSSSQNVPSKAKTTLKSKYPEATNVEWGKDGQNHEAEFTVGESEYTVLFDNSGKWVKTKIDNTPMNEIPQKVRDGISRSEFKTWSIKEVDTEESPEKTTYKVEVKSGMKEQELTVDKSGTIIRKGNKSSM